MVSSAAVLDKPTFRWDGHEVEVDEEGFIQQPELWSERLAAALAQTDGVSQLTDGHWKVIGYIRQYYQEFEIAPMIRKLCKETGYSLREIYELFPSGPAKGACKVAGLPKPTGCV
jgi:tRNA 2-thiouridine synthesizing protein E